MRLAELSGLSHPFLSQLERGHARPSMVSLERIARALGSSQLELIAAAGTGNIGLTLDIWHLYTSGGTNADLDALTRDQIGIVHVNDAPAGIDRDEQQDLVRALPLATGVLDIVPFMQKLKTLGFDGPVMPEPFSKSLEELAASDPLAAANETARSMNALWDAAGVGETPPCPPQKPPGPSLGPAFPTSSLSDFALVTQLDLVARLAHETPGVAWLFGDDDVEVARFDADRRRNTLVNLTYQPLQHVGATPLESADLDDGVALAAFVRRGGVAGRGGPGAPAGGGRGGPPPPRPTEIASFRASDRASR